MINPLLTQQLNQLRERNLESEIALINKRQRDYEGIEGPLWLHMLGYADWEVEKRLLIKERETNENH